ncbi:NlpC/P60 family protein [Limosilactobacillus fastidiosus]|uniref:C40 family peptidase n=1 Tax=Limosilactobacillus fastidiosus TaxID=2759855 RepID=A0ABR6E5Z8_9LACO|nr:NlpC/P60 family protein [Limosilactobacillus fastidiosus]MBB1062618.1 C40 family peptidase [Limosilactobacillus fastidiosus]MCD7083980.1 NlpC/P60 family protein [Limosilactobacillus fastidiosus]
MDAKKHYKLFKAGKSWCTMAITVFALTVGFVTTNTVVHADTTPSDSQSTLVNDNDNISSQAETTQDNTAKADTNQQKTGIDYQTPVNDGHLDSASVNVTDKSVNFSGWHATNHYQEGMNHYVIVLNGANNQELYRSKVTEIDRPDVQKVYPKAPISGEGGFNIEVPSAKLNNAQSLRLVSRYTTTSNGESSANGTDYWFPVITTKAAYLDNFYVNGNKLVASGWHVDDQAAAMPNHFVILYDQTKGSEVARKLVTNTKSADLPKAGYATVANAANARFSVGFDITPAMMGDQFILISRYSASKDGNSNYSDYWFNDKTVKLNNNRAGYLDTFRVSGNQVIASGWHADDDSAIYPDHFLILYDKTANREVARQEVATKSSADVASHGYGNINNADHSRFSTSFKITPAMAGHQLVLISRYSTKAGMNTNYADYWFNSNVLTPYNNRAGYLDQASVNGSDDTVTFSGWHADDAAQILPNHFLILFDQTANHEVARKIIKNTASADVASHGYGNISNAGNSRFNATFKITPAMAGHRLVLVSRYSDSSDINNYGNYADYWFNNNVVDLNHNNAWLDNFSQNGSTVNVAGWHVDDMSLPYSHHFIILYDLTTNREVGRQEVAGNPSDDLLHQYGNVLGVNKTRFNVNFNVGNNHDAFQVISRYSNSATGEGQYSQNWINNRYLNAYQNPGWMYQISYTQIQPSGPVGHNIGPGYEGIKVQLVKGRLGTGGYHYTVDDGYRIMNVQRAHGLPATGWVDFNTWKALGLPADQWTSIDSYIAPLGAGAGQGRAAHIESMISQASKYIGKPWLEGCSSYPAYGVDCSGLVMQALYAAGINPTSCSSIYHGFPGNEYNSRNLFSDPHFMNVAYGDRQRGDLVFYYAPGTRTIIHIGIYLGNNQILDSWPPRVGINPIVNWQHPVVAGIRRVFA